MTIRKQIQPGVSLPPKKIRSYGEVVDYLNAHWDSSLAPKSLDQIKKIDTALGHPSKKVNALLVAGTNGKSITLHLAAKLLKEEGLSIGTFSSPHILTYNERVATNLETIANKEFADAANRVIGAVDSLDMKAHSSELLTMIALLYFVEKKVDVALLEISEGGEHNPVNVCNALVTAITRVTPNTVNDDNESIAATVTAMMGTVKKDTWVVTGDQNKANLEQMQKLTAKKDGNWAMPIRKLAPLSYPFEQLHGRCAAIAERIAHIFMEKVYNKNATVTADSLLSRKKSKRGRPTLEEKKKAALKPRKTLEQFWREELCELPARFEILKKEKPAVLLDTSSNMDAFEHILLGIRLLHYKNPLKGFSLIMAASEDSFHSEEFLKVIRYFFKKISGQIYVCPIESPIGGTHEETSWDNEKVTNALKSMKVKAHACATFSKALEAAQDAVDKKDGLICVTGSRSVVAAYWRTKGVKKF